MRTTFLIILVLVLTKVSGLLKDAMLAWTLGPSSIADAYFISVYVAGLAFGAALGTIPVSTLPKFSVHGNSKSVFDPLRSDFIAILVISLITGFALLVSAEWVASLFSVQDQKNTVFFIRVSAFTFPLSAATTYLATVGLSQNKKVGFNIMGLTTNLVFVIAILIWREAESFHYVVMSTVLAWIMLLLFFLVRAQIEFKRKFSVLAILADSKLFFYRSRPLYLEQLIPLSCIYFAAVYGVGSVAIFSFANKLFLLFVTVLMVFVNSYLLPDIARNLSTKENLQAIIDGVFMIISLLLIPICMYAITSSRIGVDLVYGNGSISQDDVIMISNLFNILIMTLPVFLLKEILTKFLILKNSDNWVFFCHVLAACIFFALNYFIDSSKTLLWVPCSLLVTYTVTFVLLLVRVIQLGFWSPCVKIFFLSYICYLFACYSFSLVSPLLGEASLFFTSTLIFGGYLVLMSEKIARQISGLNGLRAEENMS